MDLDSRNIGDLTGLEHFQRLTGLSLANNRITDLTPLAGLTGLTTLTLNGNRITDVSALSRLTNLTSLLLFDNQIRSLEVIAGLTSLTRLEVQRNWIRDLGPLSRLTALTRLDISENPISSSSLAPLSRLTSLERLTAHETGVSDLTGVPVSSLTRLVFNGNRITSIAPLQSATSLTHLYLSGNRITDLSPLQGKTALTDLGLSGNEDLADISPLQGLTGLNILFLQSTSVADLAPLADNTGLTGSGDNVFLRNNPRLNAQAATHVATLTGRSVNVVTNNPITLDRQVRGARVTPGEGSLTVTWGRVATATGFTPTGYLVQWKSGAQRMSTSATPARHQVITGLTTTSYTITGLQPGIQYQVRVRVNPVEGNDNSLRELYGTPTAPPEEEEEDRTEDVTVRAGVESLSVSWKSVVGASGYKVQWKSGKQDYDADARQAQVAGGETTSYTITELTAGTRYKVRVIATAADGDDGRPSAEATGTPLAPPVGVTVADVGVKEGEAAKLMVVLDEPATSAVTVKWSTRDGTAAAGEDYRAMSGSLTFEPGGERKATVTVETLQDRRVEPAETFRVLLTEVAGNATLEVNAATVTISDDDAEAARGKALGMALAGMGRWAAADAVAVIAERFGNRPAGQGAGAQASLAGRSLAGYRLDPGRGQGLAGANASRPWMLPEELADSAPALTVEELLAGSRFDLPLSHAPDRLSQHEEAAAPAGAGWRIWAQGAAGGFGSQPAADSRADGIVFGGYLGIDYDLHRNVLVGLALGHNRGGVDYEIDSVTKGKADLVVTSALPYARWRPLSALEVWGLGGIGLGTAAVRDEAGRAETDLLAWLGAAGVRHAVATWQKIEVGLQADAFLTDLRPVPVPGCRRPQAMPGGCGCGWRRRGRGRCRRRRG